MSVPHRPQRLDWRSPAPGDLQIASWRERSSGFIWCVLRNSNPDPLEYNDLLLGWHEFVHLLARKKGDVEWHWLKRIDWPWHYDVHMGVGSTADNIYVLQPGEEISPLKSFSIKDAASGPRYTYYVPLDHFVWPEELTGNVEVMIRQSHFSAKHRSKKPFQTAPMTVDLDALQALTP